MTKKIFFAILMISLLLGWQLLRPGFYKMHDDLQVMRLFQMDRCFKDGQIPCRFAPDMAQNYGQPLFNFYSAFPYYLGEFIHLIGFSFVDTAKLLFLVSLFLSGIFSFLLARYFVSAKASLVTAVAYMAMPYHAVDIFVRGALAESWGLTIVPLVLYCLFRLSKKPSSVNSLLLSLSLAVLLTTHNLTALISAPIFVVFGLYILWLNQNRRQFILYTFTSLIFGLGLSAFFLLPVIFEKNLIQTNFLTSDYFDFRAHFVTIGQLFTRLTWGYGPSRFNSFQYPETLSFFVGVLPIIALFLTPIVVYANRKDKKKSLLILIIYALCLFSLFMTHARSIFIWEKLPTLSYLQFPWRFLGPASLFASLLIGFLADMFIVRSSSNLMTVFLIIFIIVTNFSYFRFEKYLPQLNDQQKLTGVAYDEQIRGALLDYLPVTSIKIPEKKAPSVPQIINGIVSTNYFDHRSNYLGSEFDVYSDLAIVEFPVMYFPGWVVYQNRQPTPISIDIKNDFGLIRVSLTKGHHLVQGFFENTPIRTIGNLTTFISGIVLTLWFVISQKEKNEK